jgi:hypothetical protein
MNFFGILEPLIWMLFTFGLLYACFLGLVQLGRALLRNLKSGAKPKTTTTATSLRQRTAFSLEEIEAST